jgi:uncharacterized integral membrane protein
MTGVKKVKVAVGVVVLVYLAVIVLWNQEQVTLSLLPGTAATMTMWEGLLAVVTLLVGFAIGFFFGRASVKQ